MLEGKRKDHWAVNIMKLGVFGKASTLEGSASDFATPLNNTDTLTQAGRMQRRARKTEGRGTASSIAATDRSGPVSVVSYGDMERRRTCTKFKVPPFR